jgi:iron complex outermembrane receptor protein
MIPRCTLAVLLILCSTAIAAAPDPPDELEEVQVTARRTPEDAQRMPLVVEVVPRSVLQAGGVEGLDALANQVPGFAFESMWGGSNSAPMLRGLQQPSTEGDNIGVFVDDVYQASRSAIDVDMLDLERVEIVRGPQNTLFGRSTFAGAIRYVAARPTADPVGELQLSRGSSEFASASGMWSQAIGSSAWLGRVALSHRQSHGTWSSVEGESLGGVRRNAVALALARELAAQGSVSLNLRFNEGRYEHPPSASLGAADYNCGAYDAASGYWSSYCGKVPISRQLSITPGLPESRMKSGQAALHLAFPLGGITARAMSSYYRATAASYRDFDGSAAGFELGVCAIGINCPPTAGAVPVIRFVRPNVVSRAGRATTDWSQELNIGNDSSGGMRWLVGVAGSWTRNLFENSFGADRGDLPDTERLTSIIATDPFRVGLASPLNRALVDDSRAQQLLQAQWLDHSLALAVFGMLDVPVSPLSRARVELRAERDLQRTDSRYAGYAPDTGPDPPAVRFSEVTPRVSIDLSPGEHWYGYVSLARGARAGGINTAPGLDASEIRFEPEYNLTTELGVRYTGRSMIQGAELTVYHVDWRNAQIMGLSTTPGVNFLITTNTAGIISRGFEASIRLRLGSMLSGSLAWSRADARFRQGSDDAGARVECGLLSQPAESDFCNYGPPRLPTGSNITLVPYLDGNRTARTPRNSWNFALQLRPLPLGNDWQLGAEASLAGQDDRFERPVNGARFGARQLLGSRVSLFKGAWSLTLWGRNLTDERYISTAASRGSNYYPTMPRPLDLMYGERRRVGLSVSLHSGAQ